MDIQKARNALEATAGNMEMAAQLYWDDYIASQAVSNAAAHPPPPPPPQQDMEADRKIPARKEESHNSENEDDPPSPGLRRSLDGEFGRAADEGKDDRGNNDEEDEGDEDDDDDDEDVMRGQPQVHHPFAGDRPAAMAMDDSSDDEEGGGQDQDVIDQRQRQRQILRDAILGQQARLDMGESVSVSDDETGCAGVWKIVGTMVAQLDEDDAAAVTTRRHRHLPANQVEQRVREAAAAVADKVLSQPDPADDKRKRRKLRQEDEEDDADYISDSDWLEDDASSVKDPFELLWGTRTASQSVPANASLNDNAEGNIVADEDGDENSGIGVPHTWLHACFSLSECGTGLVVQPPKVEDIEFFTWRQQQNQGRNGRNGVPPPYHCKAITAIMSIVTAMLYTGASIQGDEVNCTSAKKPFAELSAAEKKREFEGRLADALAALMFIAGQASFERKRRAMKNASGSGPEKECKSYLMKRRLHLIPTCTWEDDPSAGMPRQPDSPPYRHIQVATSLTNIDDIRLFVLSNIRTFTARGGVALLLETILRIHGKGVIQRMMHRARKDAGVPNSSQKGLIHCTCEDRQKQMYGDKPLPANLRNDPSKLLDTTPPGHECVSVELISLLLTGTIHSSWVGWSARGLDFGVLTKKPGEVGCGLARPEKPVWVLQGDTCYSLVWPNDTKDLSQRNVAKLDKPGAVLDFIHWNCWYQIRNKSEFRLIAASNSWKPPVLTKRKPDAWGRNPLEPRNTAELLLERRRFKHVNIVSADEHQSSLQKEAEFQVTEADLESVSQNPEDENYYPKNYKMWRFDMGDGKLKQEQGTCGADDVKMRAERWVPYHRLTAKNKLIIDTKLGPKIKSILWTRWPGARIDKFAPECDAFPVV